MRRSLPRPAVTGFDPLDPPPNTWGGLAMLSRSSDPNAIDTQPSPLDAGLHRWEQEQLFEEDLRAVLNMLRPNRQERLLGWSEYRTGGAGFRATISWDPATDPA